MSQILSSVANIFLLRLLAAYFNSESHRSVEGSHRSAHTGYILTLQKCTFWYCRSQLQKHGLQTELSAAYLPETPSA
jgi:hypothetical protein